MSRRGRSPPPASEAPSSAGGVSRARPISDNRARDAVDLVTHRQRLEDYQEKRDAFIAELDRDHAMLDVARAAVNAAKRKKKQRKGEVRRQINDIGHLDQWIVKLGLEELLGWGAEVWENQEANDNLNLLVVLIKSYYRMKLPKRGMLIDEFLDWLAELYNQVGRPYDGLQVQPGIRPNWEREIGYAKVVDIDDDTPIEISCPAVEHTIKLPAHLKIYPDEVGTEWILENNVDAESAHLLHLPSGNKQPLKILIDAETGDAKKATM